MHKFSLYEEARDLKIKLKTNIFLGEASWKKSANICKGDIIPVLLRNRNNGTKYLHSMRWGTNLFSNDTQNAKQLQNQARDDKLLSTNNNNNNPWPELVANSQRCVIAARGFYINGYTEVINAKYKTKYNDKQPYYVTPYVQSEGEFFYIAALYRVQRLWSTINKYSVISITKSTQGDDQLQGYNQRMPYLLRPRDIDEWLNPKVSIQHIFSLKYKIRYNQFKAIGLWINNDLIKNENQILRTRFEWDLEKDATMTGMHEDNFPWDQIEREALKQNNAKKNGIDFKPKSSWDELRPKKKAIKQTIIIIDDDNSKDEDDGELKQEEYTQSNDGNNNKNIKKRKKSTNYDNEPLKKKQRMNEKENTNTCPTGKRDTSTSSCCP